jgi:hypothetical protein
MATTKSASTKTGARNGNGNLGTRTTSGKGVINQGRQSPRNGNGSARTSSSNGDNNNDTRASTARASTRSNPPKQWWDAKQYSETHPAQISAGLHSLADSIWSPHLGPDPENPRGRRSNPVVDERLYQGAPRNGTGRQPAKQAPKSPTNGRPNGTKTTKQAPARTAARTRGR